VRLDVDRQQLKADGQDVAHVAITLVDDKGNKVSTDDRRVMVSLEGEGRILALDNGDLRRQRPFGEHTLPTYFGEAAVDVQSSRTAGTLRLKVDVEGLDTPNYVEISSLK
jgi:beta-galactosidase